MKKLMLWVCFLFLFLSATYAVKPTPNKPKKISITVDLTYQRRNSDGEFIQQQIQNVYHTTPDNHRWNNIHDKQSDVASENLDEGNKDNIILLTKLIGADKEKIALDFLVLSTNGSKPTIVTAPKIEVHYGQSGQILINENNQKLKLNIIASTK